MHAFIIYHAIFWSLPIVTNGVEPNDDCQTNDRFKNIFTARKATMRIAVNKYRLELSKLERAKFRYNSELYFGLIHFMASKFNQIDFSRPPSIDRIRRQILLEIFNFPSTKNAEFYYQLPKNISDQEFLRRFDPIKCDVDWNLRHKLRLFYMFGDENSQKRLQLFAKTIEKRAKRGRQNCSRKMTQSNLSQVSSNHFLWKTFFNDFVWPYLTLVRLEADRCREMDSFRDFVRLIAEKKSFAHFVRVLIGGVRLFSNFATFKFEDQRVILNDWLRSIGIAFDESTIDQQLRLCSGLSIYRLYRRNVCESEISEKIKMLGISSRSPPNSEWLRALINRHRFAIKLNVEIRNQTWNMLQTFANVRELETYAASPQNWTYELMFRAIAADFGQSTDRRVDSLKHFFVVQIYRKALLNSVARILIISDSSNLLSQLGTGLYWFIWGWYLLWNTISDAKLVYARYRLERQNLANSVSIFENESITKSSITSLLQQDNEKKIFLYIFLLPILSVVLLLAGFFAVIMCIRSRRIAQYIRQIEQSARKADDNNKNNNKNNI